jgi:hypothetical protein
MNDHPTRRIGACTDVVDVVMLLMLLLMLIEEEEK